MIDGMIELRNFPSRKSRVTPYILKSTTLHPTTRSNCMSSCVELANDLWRIDLLGGVPRYPEAQRSRERER